MQMVIVSQYVNSQNVGIVGIDLLPIRVAMELPIMEQPIMEQPTTELPITELPIPELPITKLPIMEMKDSICGQLKNDDIMIIDGTGGCGKTSMVPRWCVEAGIKGKGPCLLLLPTKLAVDQMHKYLHQE
jgi:hypothetical protein